MRIPKRTFREFDSLYNEWDRWPMELSYKVYCDIIDDVNKALEGKDEEDSSTDSSSDTDV